MNQETSSFTRRQFFHHLGAVAGPVAVCESMSALGFLGEPDRAFAGPPRLPADSGRGKSVLILGAGVAGLTAAYELTKAGYICRILEAQHRVGGRNLTARNGTRVVEESPENGTTEQVCRFDSGLYLNLGPARFPYHHQRVIHYCRELGVSIEPFVMSSGANLLQTGQQPNSAVVRRRVQYDMFGYIAELLSKAIGQGCLDQELSDAEAALLIELLEKFGDLKHGRYTGSTRTGCGTGPDIHSACERPLPLELRDLLQPKYWKQRLYAPDEYEWQATIFQPKGGMDRIIESFYQRLGSMIQTRAEVQSIEIHNDNVTVRYFDGHQCTHSRVTADYCISTIPIPILREIPNNCHAEYQQAMLACDFAAAFKLGWQANGRFWENSNQIYGGISYVDDPIKQIWYPSHDFLSPKGALIGAYNYYGEARAVGALDLDRRLDWGQAGGARLHQEFNDPRMIPRNQGLSIAWQNMPYQAGGWSDWRGDLNESLAKLLVPDRRLYISGDQVSTLSGWQEGAMMSAQHVVEQIAGVRPTRRPRIERAPDIKRMIRGIF